MPSEAFKNKIRIRVNGILQDDNAVLLVQLKSPVSNELVWMPPGGGLEFGETMTECLQREFKEETGLRVDVGSLCFMNELVKPPFHAVEFYFSVQQAGGSLQKGSDPELSIDDQLLEEVRWISIEKLNEMNVVPDRLMTWLQDDFQK